jgi:HEAT repeat protein
LEWKPVPFCHRLSRALVVAAILSVPLAAGCASSIEDLLVDLESEDAEDRLDAAVELGEAGAEAAGAAKALEDRLARDPNPLIRAACARALVRIGPEDAFEAFMRALDDKDSLVREEAVLALGRIQKAAAADPLATLLAGDPAAEVRRACARVLGSLEATSKVEALIGALSDRDATVRFHAQASLQRITCRDLGPAPEDWLAWWKEFRARMEASPR